ncbi:hypothetical protein [Paucibacter sp. KBW04]|uniref:hypothetical protein n=1 Tax=Paucibacter sp. KBW04 TaxID=2153361 RepID=UPI000F58467A|nr:hypothetical protein [Paucibacter sp. KBW04]
MSSWNATGWDSVNHSQTWSLCWQAAVGRDFFVHPLLVARIRGRLIAAHQRSGRTLISFVLMPKEIHVISAIQADDSVGSIARSFGTVVSRWVHEAQPIHSPVLAGPYHAQLIESVDSLRNEVRMLAWRPVHLQLCSTPTHFSSGALRSALGLTPAKGYDSKPLLRQFGELVPAARAGLRTCIARRPTEQDWRTWELMRGLELIIGTKASPQGASKAVEGATASLVSAGGGFGVEGALELLETWVLARIHPSGSLELKVGSSELAARGRALVACLATAHQLCSAAAVARHYQRAKATLSEQMTACKSRPADQQILVTPLARILEESTLLRMGRGRLIHHSTGSGTQDAGAMKPNDLRN